MRYIDPNGKLINQPGVRMDIGSREDGRIERVCKHGIGHPIGTIEGVSWEDWMDIHGCDGCCGRWDDGST